MYLRELTLRNIRCFPDVHISFPEVRKDGNWCVILGENGMGKSTILRAIALALMSERSAARLLPNPAAWLRDRSAQGTCKAVFGGQRHLPGPFNVNYVLAAPDRELGRGNSEEGSLVHTGRFPVEFEAELDQSVAAGYGPFRRPEGGDSHPGRLPRREDAFRTLFDDSAGIRNMEDWLRELDYISKDPAAAPEPKRNHYRDLLATLKEVINSLWPEDSQVRLEVSARGVYFTGAQGEVVSLADMSDGYRTIFTLACDLLRHAVTAINFDLAQPLTKRTLLNVNGIVLIDEVDAHLHPKWQREIGFRLQQKFPQIQFIVATHSPFVAQAATPGGIIVLDRDSKTGEVRADPTLPSLRGVPAEDILQSRAFDLETTQDVETQAKMERHAALVAKRQKGMLSETGAKELARLESELKDLLRNDDDDDVMLRLEKLLREAQGKHD